MLTLILRLLAFAVAVALTADALLPVRSEFVHIEGHRRSEHTSIRHFRSHTRTNYLVDLSGGSLRSCDVGSSAYDALRDGDDVSIGVTRVLRSCDHLASRDGSVRVHNIDRWVSLFFAGLAFAVAFGWVTPNSLRSDDDDYRDRPRWLRL